MIHIRRAGAQDIGAMTDLLNEVIRQGDTTAYTEEVTRQSIKDRMQIDLAIWHLAEDDAGALLGFQWVAPLDSEPDLVAEIATFARVGQTGLGIGSALFDTTRKACIGSGYQWIRANIRADNTGGLAYYQSRGFETYGRIKDYRLGNGQIVDKVLTRYDLER